MDCRGRLSHTFELHYDLLGVWQVSLRQRISSAWRDLLSNDERVVAYLENALPLVPQALERIQGLRHLVYNRKDYLEGQKAFLGEKSRGLGVNNLGGGGYPAGPEQVQNLRETGL